MPGTLEPIRHLTQGSRATDEGDPAVPAFQEVSNREVATEHVVDGDRAMAGPGAVDHHHGCAATRQALQPRILRVDRRDENAFYALLFQEIEQAALPERVLRAVAQKHCQVVLVGDVGDTAFDVREERVGDIEHDVRQRPAAARPQLPGRVVAYETQLVDGGKNPGAGCFGDRLRAVEHVGHGAE